MRKKRIAIVTPYGAEPRTDNYAEFILAQTLIERGWDVRLYTYAIRSMAGYAHDLTYKGVPVVRCRHRFGISPKLFFSVLFFRPGTVISFHQKSFLNFSAFWAARAAGARFLLETVGILHDPYIVNDTDDPVDTIKDPLILITDFFALLAHLFRIPLRQLWENYVYHMPVTHADALIAITDDEKKYIRMIYGRDSTRIYWSAPRSVEAFPMTPPTTVVPERYLFFIGQVKKRKGWDTALRAIAALRAHGRDTHLVMVSSGDQKEAIAYAQELGVSDRVSFFAGISNEVKNWLYAHSDCVLIPSTYEGFGLAVVEASQFGKPICATAIPVLMEFLEDHTNALLFPVGDADALADSVIELQDDPALRKKITDGSIAIAAHFDYHKMVDEYLALIGRP